MAKDAHARRVPANQVPEWHGARASNDLGLASPLVLAVLVDIVHGNANVLRHFMLAGPMETSASDAIQHRTLGRRELHAHDAAQLGNHGS